MCELTNRVVRVDLTSGKIKKENIDNETISNYIGGIGIGVRVVYDEVPPGVDGLDSENRLVFAVSPITGSAITGACRYHVVAKSPQTLFTLSVSNSAGFFGPELKFAGYDTIIIHGASKKPVYLWIDDDVVEIRDAKVLWGKDTFETEDAIKDIIGDKKIKVAAIGPAGENLVRLACIVNDKGHVVGRGGFGAVMGSKKLKAIAVRGTNKIYVKDRKQLGDLLKNWKTTMMETSLHKWGTGGVVKRYYDAGMLPVKNLTTNQFEYERLTGQYIRDTYEKKHKPCYGCYIKHVNIIKVNEGPYKGFEGEEPEYELLAGLGSNLGITDPGAVAMLGEQCDRLGLDAIGTSWALSFTMEMYQKGLLTQEKLNGLDMKWGNTEAVLNLLNMIARRDGFGDILAEGPAIAAERIGGNAKNVVVSTKKNMSPKCVDIRGLPGRSLAFAVANSGPTSEHSAALHAGSPDREMGFPDGIDMRSTGRQAEAVRKGGMRKVFFDAAGVCTFTIPSPQLTNLLEAFDAVTGVRISIEEAMMIGERILNVQRCFNIKHGLTPEHDDFEERLLTEPSDGVAKGICLKPLLKGMVREYYQLMGWDNETGKPLPDTLRRLGLLKEEKDMWGIQTRT
jgi:aldehyde:ferredoxin oxidoreductase